VPTSGHGSPGDGRPVGDGNAGSTAGRSPNTRGEESRAAILAAAKASFAAEGFRGASLASVAEAAGLSQPGLLHHFPSKVALLLAVLEDRDREDGRLSSAHLAREGVEILPALGRLVEHNQGAPDIVRLFSVLLGEGLAPTHPAHDYMAGRYRRIRSRILRNLRHSDEAGEILRGSDLQAVAAVVVAVMDGLQFQWLLDPEVDMVRCYGVFRQIVEAAMTGTTERPDRSGRAPTPIPESGRRAVTCGVETGLT